MFSGFSVRVKQKLLILLTNVYFTNFMFSTAWSHDVCDVTGWSERRLETESA